MSMDFSKIKKDIVIWASGYSGINEQGRHIWLNQNAPQPAAPYVTLNIISGPTKVGINDSQIFNNDTMLYEITGVRLFSLDVNVYGRDSLQIATDLSLSIENPDVQAFFRQANITPYGSTPSVRDISQLLDTIIESRHMFELVFMAAYLMTTSTTYIETVEAQGIDDLATEKFIISAGG